MKNIHFRKWIFFFIMLGLLAFGVYIDLPAYFHALPFRKWIFFFIMLGLLAFGVYIDLPAYFHALPYYYRQVFPKKYHGPGQVLEFTNQCSGKYSTDCDKRIESNILEHKRSIIVYLPPNYKKYINPLPLIIALHGNRSNHYAFGSILPSILDKQIQAGNIPPVVMIAPDFSLGGTGLNDNNPYNDKEGSFYINSNRGRFEDYFIMELLPWVRKNYNVSDKPESTVLLGQSMGGWGAFSIGLRYPEISSILVGISPSVDARYSCAGNKMAHYDPNCYVPISSDDPNRVIMSMFGGLYQSTERDAFYTVFDSHNGMGNIWKNDMPVWERLKEYNPTDIIRDGRYGDISHTAMYVIAGDRDEYNTDAKVLSFISAASKQGFLVHPIDPIRKNGHHTPDFVVDNMPEILLWIGDHLKTTL